MNQLDCLSRNKYQRFRYGLQNTRHYYNDSTRSCSCDDSLYFDGKTFDQESVYAGWDDCWFDVDSDCFLYDHLPRLSHRLSSFPTKQLSHFAKTQTWPQVIFLVPMHADFRHDDQSVSIHNILK